MVMRQKSERFEMRLDEETALAIDNWRDQHLGGASRAHAVRVLIERGVKTATSRFSDGDKVMLVFLNHLLHHFGLAEATKLDVIIEGFRRGHHWAVDLEMGSSIFSLPSSSPSTATTVIATLEMWEVIERAFEGFTDDQRAEVLAPTEGEMALQEAGKELRARRPEFSGFDRRTEAELIEVAEFLVNKSGRFKRFRGRNLECTTVDPTQHYDSKRLEVYKEIRQTLAGRLPSPADVRKLLLARPGIPWEEGAALMAKRGLSFEHPLGKASV
jgi:uncharacterized protein YfbU (UPF0304 family)